MKKDATLIIGASMNPQRYSNKAIRLFQEKGIAHIALGLKPGEFEGTIIETEYKEFSNVDTVTLYIGSKHQDQELIEFIIRLKPRRVIFNPGAESHDTAKALVKAGIEIEMACTLVLLRTDQY